MNRSEVNSYLTTINDVSEKKPEEHVNRGIESNQ